jgi:hypothetical protein
MGVFVGVFNQRPAIFHVDINAVFAALVGDLESDRVDAAAVAEREMARGLRTGIEVLVEPSSRRTIDAAGFPFDLDDIFIVTGFVRSDAELLRPQQNVARGLQA